MQRKRPRRPTPSPPKRGREKPTPQRGRSGPPIGPRENREYRRAEEAERSSAYYEGDEIARGTNARSGPGWERAERFRSPGKAPKKAGSYAGVGPRGYTRPDERIREDVCDALTADTDLDASDLEVHVEQGRVILDGTVHDAKMKRVAEVSVARIPGVKDVATKIRVGPGSKRGAQENDAELAGELEAARRSQAV
jgi:hypothetical protein